MTDQLALQSRYPDLFEGMSDEHVFQITNIFASLHHEGWEVNREDVANLIDVHEGRISREEFGARVMEKAKRMKDSGDA